MSAVTVESCNSQNWAFGYGGTDPAKSDVPTSQDQSGCRERETDASETSGSRRGETDRLSVVGANSLSKELSTFALSEL